MRCGDWWRARGVANGGLLKRLCQRRMPDIVAGQLEVNRDLLSPGACDHDAAGEIDASGPNCGCVVVVRCQLSVFGGAGSSVDEE